MKMPRPVTVDFETKGIEQRPAYPPKPVGVSIKYWGKKARYYAFGHLTENNCTEAVAKRALQKAYKSDTLLFQGGKFDVDVAEVHWGLKLPDWKRCHDTLFLLFLDDPQSKDLGLKPSAEKLLGWAPEEQDAVKEWLLKNQPLKDVRISADRKNEHYWAKYIWMAPGDVVEPYANGDTERTEGVFKFLWPEMKKRKMLSSYDVERELMFILLEIERQGIPVNLKRLRKDHKLYTETWEKVDTWIFRRLKSKYFNLDSGAELVAALTQAKKVDLAILGTTPKTGKPKTSKGAIKAAVSDKTLSAVLNYRASLKTCVSTFLNTWLKMAEASDGRIFTTWFQTRSSADGGKGARTGRFSSSPNFQNIPKLFPILFRHEKPSDKSLPIAPFDLPLLPKMRSYIVPWDENYVLIDRDYSQQELRILAHYEAGLLKDAYNEAPWLDIHEKARVEINEMLGTDFTRGPIKTIGFGLIYGMGYGALAAEAGTTVNEAKLAKKAYLTTFPGLKDMQDDMKFCAKEELPIRTWGGRENFCEDPVVYNNRIITFEYKMLNTLIQGSAGDCTKKAIINYWHKKPKNDKLYLTVHDETLVSVPKKTLDRSMAILRDAMEDVKFDVPMLSEGTWSEKNWADLKNYDKKGVRCG